MKLKEIRKMFSVLLMELFQVSEDLLGNKTPKTPKCIVDPLICPNEAGGTHR